MAGIVKARCEVFPDSSIDVVPEPCPSDGEHMKGMPRCFRVGRDGEHRACIYWVACTSPSQRGDRLHPTALHSRATALGARSVNCQVICLRAKANRPPGC